MQIGLLGMELIKMNPVVLLFVGFILGFIFCYALGFGDRYFQKKTRKNCQHGFSEDLSYSHVIWDDNLTERKTCKKFQCINCGTIKFKEF